MHTEKQKTTNENKESRKSHCDQFVEYFMEEKRNKNFNFECEEEYWKHVKETAVRKFIDLERKRLREDEEQILEAYGLTGSRQRGEVFKNRTWTRKKNVPIQLINFMDALDRHALRKEHPLSKRFSQSWQYRKRENDLEAFDYIFISSGERLKIAHEMNLDIRMVQKYFKQCTELGFIRFLGYAPFERNKMSVYAIGFLQRRDGHDPHRIYFFTEKQWEKKNCFWGFKKPETKNFVSGKSNFSFLPARNETGDFANAEY